MRTATRPKCGDTFEIPRCAKYFSPDEFKAHFKIGDTILGYATKKPMIITGIGATRFFYVEPGDTKERMAKQNSYPWILVVVEND